MPGSSITPSRKKTRTATNRAKVAKRGRFAPGSRGYGAPRGTISMGLGFPMTMNIRHKYRETVFMTCTAGAMSNYLFSCNSLYDPNKTGTGHQPMYYDQLAAIYGYYTVIGSKMTMRLTHDAGSNSAVTVALSKNEDATVTPTNVDGVIEAGWAKSKTLGESSTDPVQLSSSWSLYQRHRTADISNDQFRADINSSPTDQTFYQISLQPTDRASTNSYNVEVLIEYMAVWSDIKEIAQS